MQALYFLKSGQIKTVTGLAKALGKNRSTVPRWWPSYRSRGLQELLGKNPLPPGRFTSIPDEAIGQ